MKIALASDHRGYKLKSNIIENLKKENFEIKDLGTDSEEAADYPDFGFKAGEALQKKEADVAILICGTGIGISIAANKVKGVRCAKIDSIEDAMYAHLHNNANAIAFKADTDISKAMEMVHTYLKTSFSTEEKHRRRVAKVDGYNAWE